MLWTSGEGIDAYLPSLCRIAKLAACLCYGTQDMSIGFTFGEFSRSAESWRIGTTLPWGSRDIKLTMTWGFQGGRHVVALVGGVQRLALRSWQTLMYPKDARKVKEGLVFKPTQAACVPPARMGLCHSLYWMVCVGGYIF